MTYEDNWSPVNVAFALDYLRRRMLVLVQQPEEYYDDDADGYRHPTYLHVRDDCGRLLTILDCDGVNAVTVSINSGIFYATSTLSCLRFIVLKWMLFRCLTDVMDLTIRVISSDGHELCQPIPMDDRKMSHAWVWKANVDLVYDDNADALIVLGPTCIINKYS